MMTDLSILIYLVPISFLTLILFPYMNRQQKQEVDELIAKRAQNNPEVISYYFARYRNSHKIGMIYIQKNKIWYERSGGIVFDTPIDTIKKILYNNRSIQIQLIDGTQHTLRHLYAVPYEDSGPSGKYSAMYHHPEIIKDFLQTVHLLGLKTSRNKIGYEPLYYYIALGCGLFALIIFTIALISKFVIGVN